MQKETKMIEEEISEEKGFALMEQSQKPQVFGNNNTTVFYSMQIPDSREGRLKIYNYMTKADYDLRSCINMVLKIKDIIAFPVQLRDENGEVFEVIKCNLIDEKGKVYSTCSKGVFNSLSTLFSIVGMPTWEKPISLKVVEKGVTSNSAWKTLVLEAV